MTPTAFKAAIRDAYRRHASDPPVVRAWLDELREETMPAAAEFEQVIREVDARLRATGRRWPGWYSGIDDVLGRFVRAYATAVETAREGFLRAAELPEGDQREAEIAAAMRRVSAHYRFLSPGVDDDDVVVM